MPKDIIMIGAGGHARVIADMVKKSGDNVEGFLDDDLSKDGVIGKIDDCTKFSDCFFVIAIGNNSVRKAIAEKFPDLKYRTVIHPRAVISEDVEIGVGTVIMANAVINANTKIGAHCIINTASVVEHDNVLSDFVHISPGATLCGGTSVGELTQIGAGAVTKNGTSVCSNCIVGISAAVTEDITEPGVYAGVPAKKIK